MTRKTNKICLVCGTEFKGTEARFTCGNACRTAMSRMLSKGKKPEFWVLAKSKGQKIPLFFQKPIIKIKEPSFESKIDFVESKPESYNSEKISFAKIDEAGLVEPPKVLTLQEKLGHNAKLDIRINEEKRKDCPKNIHPKLFRMQQDDIIAELEKQKL